MAFKKLQHVVAVGLLALLVQGCSKSSTSSDIAPAGPVHRAHLAGSTFAAPVTCAACHSASGFAVDFSQNVPLLSAGARFDPATKTCSNVSCHGSFTFGAVSGTSAKPAWTDTTPLDCSSCHGMPPSNHPAVAKAPAPSSCVSCHPDTLNKDGTINLTSGAHLNGKADVSGGTCTSCHGTEGRAAVAGADANQAAAPPVTANPTGVAGVHLAHVNQGSTGAPLANPTACSACHPSVTGTTHPSGVVDVVYTGIALAAGAAPSSYDLTNHTCSNTYCHGNFPGGNRATAALSWSAAGKLTCTGCHGNPPATATTRHPANASCGSCHTGYTKDTVTASTHVDGTVQKPANGCTACHGVLAGPTGVAANNTSLYSAPGSGAGSVDASGNSATTSRGVGAHEKHLTPTLMSKTIACSECHGTLPADGDTTHSDGTVAIAWGALASANGSSPTTSVSGPALNCSSTWCHGGNLALIGATASTIAWNSDTKVDCTSCHGNPPTATAHGHPSNTDCASCHGTGYTYLTATTGSITGAALVTHLDGKNTLLAPETCTTCHGKPARASVAGADLNQASSPPSAASATGVAGVHLAHVNQGSTGAPLSTPLACVNCHTVPTNNDHGDGIVGVIYSSLSVAQGAVPTAYNQTSHTCSNTYCHGNFAGGNVSAAALSWATEGKLTCTGCHGNPPPTATTRHPANASCGSCHTGYTSNSVPVAGHVDGLFQKPANGCTACHGVLSGQGGAAVANTSPTSAPGYGATAVDTLGNVAATFASVGAHAAHLTGTRWRSSPIACSECHVVPASGDTSHSTGSGSGGARATVAFGTLSRTGGILTAAYAGSTTAAGGNAAGTCSNTYCHGNFKNGATAFAPSWLGGAVAADCGSCHGMPPGGTHPRGDVCADCHTGYTATTVNPTLHLNGIVEVANMTCTSCHGTASRASVAGADLNQASAPPVDFLGATTGVLVGTHVSHSNPAVSGATYKPIACTECHPDQTGNVSHSDGTVNVTFAKATGANLAAFAPTFVQGNGTSTPTTCATYCHGASLDSTTTKGTVATWSWNGATADCGSCHKSPPTTANHHNAAALTTCSSCHSSTVDATGAVLVAGGKHVNGLVDTANLSCFTCHGNPSLVASGNQDPNVASAPTGTGAPDTYGHTTATNAGVGTHASHVLGTRSRPVLCNACHAVPGTQVHKTGVATAGAVVLGNLATTGSIASASYVGAGGSCASTYCHGNLGGGIGSATVSPSWTTTGTLVCNSCHGMPPALTSTGGYHPSRTDCGTCHSGYTSTTVNASTHVNGAVEYVAQTCTSCHGDPARTGSDTDLVAFSSAPPVDSSNLSSGARVGAHLKHLLLGADGGPAYSKQVACSECHKNAIPVTQLHADGQPNVAFGTLGTQGTGGTYPAPSYTSGNCSNTYCHGNFKNGAGTNAISWSGTAACGSCHGNPPGGTHPQGSTLSTCGKCHGNYDNATQSIVDPAGHVDGSVDLSNLSCSSCHGDPTRMAVSTADANVQISPPLVASATGVAGVHMAHVNQGSTGTPLSNALACVNCHTMPATNDHSDGVIGVAYSSLSVAQGAAPSAYNLTNHTCSNTYCHGNFPGGNLSASAVSWNPGSPAKLTCTGCHGNPPATATTHHPVNTSCGSCHTGTTSSTVTASTHVDGIVQKPAAGCTACHGVLAGQSGAAVDNTSLASAPGFSASAVDTAGNTAATFAAVGAHGAHLTGTRWRSTPMACSECHTVPANLDTSHATGSGSGGARATIAFGALARTGGIVTATYSGSNTASGGNAAGTCSNTYCHGNMRNGPANNSPSWLGGAAAAACGSCHDLPPGGAHPMGTNCADCHDGYTISSVHPTKHMNGVIDVVNLTCTACHGTASRANGDLALTYDPNQASAPPADSRGLGTSVLVGTHLAHSNPVAASAVYKPVACTECHPDNSGNTSHANFVEDLTFATATAANLGGFTATFTQGNGTSTPTTCATYCHGSSLNPTTTKGSVASWAWNGAATDCGGCHKSPPGTANHHNAAAITTCNKCHSTTVDAAGAVLVAGGKHLNGAVDYPNLTCTTCHGNPSFVASGSQDPNAAAAPTGAGAPDTYGNVAVATAGVGTHASHILGARSKPVLCSACHAVPGTQVHKTGVATAGTVLFAYLATTGGASPTYPGPGGTCSNTYCHGTLGGGIGAGKVSPGWTTAGTLVCNSCHGMPPAQTSTGGYHPNRADCGTCHAGYTSTTVNAASHVNGAVEYVTQTCTSCHGDPVRTGSDADLVAFSSAPPVDSSNLSSGAKVGAHLKHLLTGGTGGPAYSKQVACAECHKNAIPVTQLHADGQPNVAFGTLATKGTGGTYPAPSYASGTCSNTYCHGNFMNGAGTNAISWTGTAACGSCHANPPGGTHPPGSTLLTCGNCHGNYDNATQSIIDPAGHVDGSVDLSKMSCTACHGDAARVVVSTADSNVKSSPPIVSPGSTGVAGVHLAHVNQGSTGAPLSSAFKCVNCHSMPATNDHSDGIIGVTYGSLSVAQGAAPSAYNLTNHTCSNTYCHGNFPGGNQSASAISWSTAGKLACTGCHGNPPATATTHHPANSSCGSCHTGTTSSTVTASSHVDGVVQKPANGCTACHGVLAGQSGSAVANNSPTSAPGYGGTGVNASGSSAVTSRGVGAHAKHLTPTLRTGSIACTECHGTLPAAGDITHANGSVAISWGSLASTLGSSPTTSVVGTTLSCSANWCHGGNSALSGATASTIAWNTSATVNCTSCHGNPPAGNGHPLSNACASCHGTGYTYLTATTGSISGAALNTHIDGLITLVAAQSCTSCHGTPGRTSVAGADASQASAPPAVASATGIAGVHLAHVNQGSTGAQLSAPFACVNCHTVPAINTHSNGVIEVTYASLSVARGATPSAYDLTNHTCSNTYCHGNFPGGNQSASAISWSTSGKLTCTACHGNPPSLTSTSHHPANTNCVACHGTGFSSSTVAAATHVDGAVTLSRSGCSLCHGDLTQTGVLSTSPASAPGYNANSADTTGAVLATFAPVGAHAAHLNGTHLRSTAITCNECHVVPINGDVAHATGSGTGGARATLTFGTLARTGGIVTATYSGSSTGTGGAGSGTCSNTYCHGNFRNGALDAPSWLGGAAGQACGSCHGVPPGGTHPAPASDCGSCHPGYTSGSVNPIAHLNGVIDSDRTACSTCHSSFAAGMNQNTSYHHVMAGDPGASYPTYGGPTLAEGSRNCNICHMKHEFTNPATNVRDTVNIASPTGATVDYNAVATDKGLCLGCHNQGTMNKDVTRQKNDGTLATARLDATSFAGSSHDYFVAGSFGGNAFQVDCVKCHNSDAANEWQSGTYQFSIHNSTDRRLRAPMGRATITDDDSEGFCYRCHSNAADAIGGTKKAVNANDWYGAVTTMPAQSTGVFAQMQKVTSGSGHLVASYTAKHRPNPAEETLSFISANKHVDCADCHDSHLARRGNVSESGTVTAAAAACTNTTTSLCDTSQNWVTNAWKGFYVDTYTASSGANIARAQITGNTATQLTLATTTALAPVVGNAYRISMRANGGAVSSATANTLTDSQSAVGGLKAWSANAFAGWYVSIVLGTGAGQTMGIASNTGNVLTIASAWATIPTTTSRYVISKLPNVMLGSSGVSAVSWSGGTVTAWGEARTFTPAAGSTTPLPDATAEWQVCFKCHSAANTSLATWNSSWTDMAQAFNPRNQSYHPVLAPAAAYAATGFGNTQVTTAQVTSGWKPGDTMACSDCHGNDDPGSAATQGPHASAVKFILKGPNTRWPFQADGVTRWTVNNSTTGVGTAAGLFCRNCHPALSGVHSTDGAHKTLACTGCHLVIPHGGKVKRLMRTTNTPAPYADTGTAAQLRAYAGGTSESTSCGAGCTAKHPLAATTTNSW